MNSSSASGPTLDVPTACCAVIEPAFERALDDIDDALYSMTGKADDGQALSDLMAAMQTLRQERRAVTDRFLDSLDLALYRYASGQPVVPEASSEPVGDWSQTLDRMRRRGEQRHGAALDRLYNRFGEVRGGTSPDHQAAPISPASLCTALDEAIAPLALDSRSLIVVGKEFERSIIDRLDGICEEILETLQRPVARVDAGEAPPHDLIERGVRAASQIFSQMRTLVMRRVELQPDARDVDATHPSPPQPEQSKPAETASGHPASEEPPAIEAGESTPSAPEPDRPKEGAPSPTEPITYDREDLLAALAVLQARVLNDELDGVSQAGPEAIREALLEQLERLRREPEPASLSADHEAAMALAGMVFEFLREQHEMAPEVRAALMRLQIPFIKAALLQPELLAKNDHPARQLLEALADAGVAFGQQTRVRDKVDEVAQRILSEFENDFRLFERLLSAFSRFASQLERDVVIEARKAARMEEGRKRIRDARTIAAKAIGQQTRDANLPEPVRDLLRRPWINAMTLTYLRHGSASTEWRQALQFVEDLVWSLAPKSSAADVARLQSMLPALSRQLGNGLEDVAMTRQDMKAVFESLRAIYRELVDARYRDALHLPDSFGRRAAAIRQSLLARPGRGADTAATGPAPASSAPPSNEAVWLKAVRGLQPGTWFDLKSGDGPAVRAKLSWVNPITHTLLFVDADGLKLANKSDRELAEELRSGEATLLENVPLFERAMAAISQQLRGQDER